MYACTHCHEPTNKVIYDRDTDPLQSHPFCCQGCLTVYQILHQKGFAEYYNIKEQAGTFRRRAPVELGSEKYSYLDDQMFLSEYTEIDSQNLRNVDCYLEGIHCLACLWLIERLPLLNKNIHSSKLDIEKSVVSLKILSDSPLSDVARQLHQLGYKPHVIKSSEDQKRLKNIEERKELLKIGIAAAGASNIMIYAVSLYAGASEAYAEVFNALTVIFALPVLTYSSWGFYRNAWNSLKNRMISIDVPIAMALIMGFVMGVFNLINKVHENYFDSLTALVFLLLLSRYFLKKIQERSLRVQDLDFFHHHESVEKVVGSNFDECVDCHPKYLNPQDIIRVKARQFIPVDGIVIRGRSHTNNSLLTGESNLITIEAGDEVFSGTQNIDDELFIKVTHVGENTRLGKIIDSVMGGWSQKSHILDFTNKVSQYFILTVLALSALLFFINLQSQPAAVALERAFTLLIVTCPCALALAIPLTFTRSLGLASQQGVFLKNDAVIEKILKIKNIFLDKTGTLTLGKLQINEFNLLKPTKIPVESIIYNLERYSAHPIARSLMEFVSDKNPQELKVSNHKEMIGVGVEGMIEEVFYEIKNYQIFENSRLVATFKALDLLRSESKGILGRLKNKYQLHILSGDRKDIVDSVANQLGISSVFSEQTPESKSHVIKSYKNTLMIGDGANDAIALSQADVGIAVQGSMALSLKASDIYIVTPGLSSVENILVLSQETMNIIYRNVFLSLLYNSLSVMAVFSGHITPLVAAIIMPLSSLTVLVSTFIGTKKLRHLWK